MKYIQINKNSNTIVGFSEVPDDFDITLMVEPELDIFEYPIQEDPAMLGAGILSYKSTKNKISSIKFVPKPLEYGNWKFESKQWINVLPDETKFEMLKLKRNAQIASSDWTQFNDTPLTKEKQKLWKIWRDQLRNLPQNFPKFEEAQAELTRLVANKP